MSLDRAVTLLKSSDITDNRNGCALVINSAATASNVSDIIRANILQLLVPKLNTTNDDLKMRICWVVNNLCVHDSGRDAVHRSNIVNEFPSVLKSRPIHTETIQKLSWAITNLARHPQALREISRSGTLSGLVDVLNNGTDDQKTAVIQPLCNLVLDPDNQMQFYRNGGSKPAVQMLQARDAKTKELAVTLISFVTTNHDIVREGLLSEGVLRSLNKILNGDGTEKMQELALNGLVNLSLSSKAEAAILDQGAVSPVIGLLSSDSVKLRTQAAMLLSNLLTNEDIRAHVRYLGWADPMSSMLQNGNAESVQQVVRCIINITFDNHCRYICSKSGIPAKLKNASTRLRDKTVTDLTNTACSNLEVSVSKDIEREVDDAMRTGRVTKVSAPTASMKDTKKDDFEGLDDLLGGKSKPAAKPAASKPKPTNNAAFDDLDSLLDSGAPAKSNNSYGNNSYNSKPPVTKSYGQSNNAPASKPKPSNNDFDDLDSLLDSTPAHKPASKPYGAPASKPKPSNNDFDDLDSLLDATPSKNNYQTRSATTEIDLDDLLDISPSNSSHKHNNNDDIDSLLADIGGRNSNNNDDDLDDLLSGISGGSHGGHNNDDIDDLLADLTK